MTLVATINASAEAHGHPSNCTEPANGSVQADSDSSVHVNGTDVASVGAASINFSSHSHDHSSEDGCHNNQSHSIDPDTVATSVSINDSPVYLVGSGVGTDPGSGGNVDITDGGANETVNVT